MNTIITERINDRAYQKIKKRKTKNVYKCKKKREHKKLIQNVFKLKDEMFNKNYKTITPIKRFEMVKLVSNIFMR